MKKMILLLTLITCVTLTGCQKKQEDISLAENKSIESTELSEDVLEKEEIDEKDETKNLEEDLVEESLEKEDDKSDKELEKKIDNNKQSVEEKKQSTSTQTTSTPTNSSKKQNSTVNSQSTSTKPQTQTTVTQKVDPYTEAKQKYSGLDGYNLTINGTNFRMRSEYQKMVNSGWTSNNSKLSGSNISGFIKIRNGNKTMSVSLQNIINSELPYNQCIVSGILIDKSDIASGTSIVLPNNITQNSTVDDVINAYGKSGYIMEDRKYIYYKTEVKGFTILFDENNNIEQIQISNYYM